MEGTNMTQVWHYITNFTYYFLYIFTNSLPFLIYTKQIFRQKADLFG